jgi:hypothetical protein
MTVGEFGPILWAGVRRLNIDENVAGLAPLDELCNFWICRFLLDK